MKNKKESDLMIRAISSLVYRSIRNCNSPYSFIGRMNHDTELRGCDLDFDGDSIDALISELSRLFDMSIDGSEFSKLITVGDVVTYVSKSVPHKTLSRIKRANGWISGI